MGIGCVDIVRIVDSSYNIDECGMVYVFFYIFYFLNIVCLVVEVVLGGVF